jgi:hypothetical protein
MSAEPQGTVEGDFSRRLISELLAGERDDDAFVRTVADAYRNDPDAPWEVLALIDRYHRLGQLPTDRFRAIKTRVEQLALGTRNPAVPAASAPRPPAAEHTQEIRTRGRAAPRLSVAVPPRASPQQSPTPPHVSAPPRSPAPTADDDSPPGGLPGAGRFDRPVMASPRVGEVLRGRYELQSALGCGGMGTVYKALDRTRAALGLAQAHVAVKVLHEEHARRPELVAAFAREFEFTQGLSHPNVVNVHEIHRHTETVFFVMELLEGAHLSQIIARTAGRPLPRPQVLAIVRDIGAALLHAHARGVVHGDLKPHNIVVTDNGEVRVLDFGAACQVTNEPWISEFTPNDFRAATPAYASCEVLEGARPEPADDLYALACVTYVLLAGEHPFGGKTAREARALKLRPRRPKGLRVSAWTALSHALSSSRGRHTMDMGEWLERIDLHEAVARLPPQSLLMSAPPARGRWLAAAAVVTAMVAATVLVSTLAPRATRATLAAVADQTANGAALNLQRLRERIGANAAAGDPEVAASSAAAASAVGPTDQAAVLRNTAVGSSATGSAAAPISPLRFVSDVYTVGPREAAARIVIHRTGDPGRALDFVWWTEAASAKPGVDYAPLGHRREHLAAGQDTVTVYVPIVAGARRRESASFYVALNPGGATGSRAPQQRATVVVTRRRP